MHLSILHVYKLYMTINSSVTGSPLQQPPQAAPLQHHRKCETNYYVNVSKSNRFAPIWTIYQKQLIWGLTTFMSFKFEILWLGLFSYDQSNDFLSFLVQGLAPISNFSVQTRFPHEVNLLVSVLIREITESCRPRTSLPALSRRPRGGTRC